MLLIFIITTLTLFGISLFLWKELFKKFGFWKRFESVYPNKVGWVYLGDLKEGMYKLSIHGNSKFSTLIGFDFSILGKKNIGYDIFGYIESDENGLAECALYLGKGGVEFTFLINTEQELKFECTPFNNEPVKYIFRPHWWQKIGFFG